VIEHIKILKKSGAQHNNSFDKHPLFIAAGYSRRFTFVMFQKKANYVIMI